MNIDSFNQTFKAAGEKVLGFNSTQSERVRDQLRRKYSELDHKVKKMTKLDKRKFVDRLVHEAEEAAGRQDRKTPCRINKLLNNSFKNNDVPVKDIDGNVLLKETEKLVRWKEHFKSILNRPEPEQVAEISTGSRGLGYLHRSTYHGRGESCHQKVGGRWSRWSDSRNAQG